MFVWVVVWQSNADVTDGQGWAGVLRKRVSFLERLPSCCAVLWHTCNGLLSDLVPIVQSLLSSTHAVPWCSVCISVFRFPHTMENLSCSSFLCQAYFVHHNVSLFPQFASNNKTLFLLVDEWPSTIFVLFNMFPVCMHLLVGILPDSVSWLWWVVIQETWYCHFCLMYVTVCVRVDACKHIISI